MSNSPDDSLYKYNINDIVSLIIEDVKTIDFTGQVPIQGFRKPMWLQDNNCFFVNNSSLPYLFDVNHLSRYHAVDTLLLFKYRNALLNKCLMNYFIKNCKTIHAWTQIQQHR